MTPGLFVTASNTITEYSIFPGGRTSVHTYLPSPATSFPGDVSHSRASAVPTATSRLMCRTPQKLARLAHYSNDVPTDATLTSVDAQTIVLPPTTAAPSGGDSKEAGTRTARSLSYSPHKFPRLTGMSDDFSHARTFATTTSTRTAADNRHVRGLSDMEVAAQAVRATEMTAAAVALAKTALSSTTIVGASVAAGSAAATTARLGVTRQYVGEFSQLTRRQRKYWRQKGLRK